MIKRKESLSTESSPAKTPIPDPPLQLQRNIRIRPRGSFLAGLNRGRSREGARLGTGEQTFLLAVRDDFADKENSQVGAILIHSPDPGTWKTAYERRIKIWNRIDKPAFRDLAADDEGTIWVEPYLENRAEEGKVFDAVLPDGSFIRGVRITGGGAFLRYERSSSIIGKTFWRIETGEDGFSKLVRYKSGA
jgi:hypothetical protein